VQEKEFPHAFVFSSPLPVSGPPLRPDNEHPQALENRNKPLFLKDLFLFSWSSFQFDPGHEEDHPNWYLPVFFQKARPSHEQVVYIEGHYFSEIKP
jgi:hypothetical protein